MITPTKAALLNRLRAYIDTEGSRIRINSQPLSTNIGACYTVSKIAAEILRGLGYNTHVRRVAVIVGDKIGKEILLRQLKSGQFDLNEIIQKGGYTIGLGIPPEMFHFVVYIWNGEEKEIMDLTYGQADRPQHGIRAEAYWEKIDSLPETIISLDFINSGYPKSLAPVIEMERLKETFQQIITKGITILKQEGYALG